MKKLIICLVAIFSFTALASATGVTFTFANGVVTGTSPSYYEFDILAQATDDTTLLGDNSVYVNYNVAGFGVSVVDTNITVTKGTLLLGEIAPGFPYYNIVNVANNTSSRFAVTVEFNYPGNNTVANSITTTAQQLLHVKLEIEDDTESAGLSFQSSLMNGQQYKYDNSTQYDPIVATDTDDSELLDPSALEDITSGNLPGKYALKPNFPNPFNPSTTLNFDVPRNTKNLEIAVFDVLGQKVATIYQGSINSGSYSYSWNGRNLAGNLMPTGIYFATMKAQGFSQTIKMMLVK